MARMQLGSNVVIPAIQVGGNEVAGYTLDNDGLAKPIDGHVVIKGVKQASYRSFFYRFAGCLNMTRLSFPDLVYVEPQGLQRVCSECTSLSMVDFDKLERIDNAGFTGAFNTCTDLGDIRFPALKTVGQSAFGTSSLCFAKCTKLLNIWFPAAMQSTIEGMTGYASKFGAVNATIHFTL